VVRASESPELRAARRVLAAEGGKWVDGIRVLNEIERVIPPGQATRYAISVLTRQRTDGRTTRTAEDVQATTPLDVLVAKGKRVRAIKTLAGAIRRGSFVSDPAELTKAHWRGTARWAVRDPTHGVRSLEQVADELGGVTASQVRNWIQNHYVPEPRRHATNNKWYVDDELMDIYRKVREVWPGSHNKRWPVDPRSLWVGQYGMHKINCPHCDGELFVAMPAEP
jgi:hypothetical protein